MNSNRWAMLSALAAVIGVLVPIVLYSVGQEHRSLSVETVSRAILVDLPKTGSSLTLTHDGVPVSRLTAATIEVRNDGSRPIERSQFERAIVIRFREPRTVLLATIGEKAPQDLQPVISLESGVISVAPLLLNPGDRFRVTVQVRDEFQEPDVEVRITGIRSVSRQVFRESNRGRPYTLGVIGAIATLGYFYFGAFVMRALRGQPRMVVLPPLDAAIVLVILSIAGAVPTVTAGRLLGWSVTQIVLSAVALVTVGAVLMILGRPRAMRTRDSVFAVDRPVD